MPGALIPVLQIAQAMFGYLPEEALKKIALALDKPYSEVAGVVGFYSFFTTVPRGKHLVRVCLGTACYVRGGKQVLAGLKDLLRIEVGETSSDRLFSLDVGRCFGACGLAPVIMIDDDVHQRVKPARLAKILDQYREDRGTPPATATEKTKNDADHRQREGTDGPARRRPRGEGPTIGRGPQADPHLPGRQLHRLGRVEGASGLGKGACRPRRCSERVSIVGTGCLGPLLRRAGPDDRRRVLREAPPAGRQGHRRRAPRPRPGRRAAHPQAARRPRRGQRRRHGLLQAAEEDRAAQLRRDRPAADRGLHRPRRLPGAGQGLDAEQRRRR